MNYNLLLSRRTHSLALSLFLTLGTLPVGNGAEPQIRTPVYATDFPYEDSAFRRDGQWLALHENGASGTVSRPLDLLPGVYDVTLHVVGENDGRPTYRVRLNGELLGTFQPPLAQQTTEEGERFTQTWRGITVGAGDRLEVGATTDSIDGSDIAWGRWSRVVFARPLGDIGETAARKTLEEGVYGERKKWHCVTLAFEGPDTGERSDPNPFTDYRLNVRFVHRASSRSLVVPGYYAADGIAGETGATSGQIWRVHFRPDAEGIWDWECSFRQGPNIAMYEGDAFSEALPANGRTGSLEIAPSDKTGRDFRAHGRLQYTGGRYWRFAETGEAYLKGGADSPENLLAYVDFDGPKPEHANLNEERAGEAPESPLHEYAPHARDWNEGDPTWQGGKGKNLIGGLNYLASQGLNSIYFLTMNVEGDGNDVWPWTSAEERFRFDCSKLDQWDIVFTHMQRSGLLMHVVTQETENDQLLDSGALGLQRRLYYRELIARFGHHLALVWNFGEENTNTARQLGHFADYFESADPYGSPVVVHTYPGQYDFVYTPLLGHPNFEGPSLQMGDMTQTHSETLKWIARSQQAERNWVVCLDEIGPADTGVKPDADDFWHDDVRRHALWGNLMAGGAGVEWYFGYRYAHNDLGCEDWRSRENMWRLTGHALEFFRKYLPFSEMENADSLTPSTEDYCFAKEGAVYAVYLPPNVPGEIDLSEAQGRFSIAWYDPRHGGELQRGSQAAVQGGRSRVSVGNPPKEPRQDWVVLLRRQ